MTQSLPLTDDQKIFISNAIYRAVTNDLPEIIYDNNLPTSLGSGLFRWNFINRNLSETFDTEFEHVLASRGGWKLLLLRDKRTNLSFSIMSEPNFRKLQKRRSKDIHYLEALISTNKSRRPLFDQLSIFGNNQPRDENVLAVLRNKLLSGFSGVVEEHVLILFDYDFTGVTSARAVLLTPKMEIAVSEDWTQYLQSTYVPKHSILDVVLSEEEVFAKLKPQYDSQNNPVVEPVTKEGSNEND